MVTYCYAYTRPTEVMRGLERREFAINTGGVAILLAAVGAIGFVIVAMVLDSQGPTRRTFDDVVAATGT